MLICESLSYYAKIKSAIHINNIVFIFILKRSLILGRYVFEQLLVL